MRKKLMMFVAAFTLIFGMGLGTTSAYYPPPPPDDGGSTGGGENCDPAPDGISLNKICPPEG
ncbi:hypothetical protein [Bacillus sp. SM2101]|uniref:hypothetical protein n=1 Tax=Bacillus sp. SM2101 TaxID=2805366 RepID=UPI001BDE60E4|nr:hypothetical protein [Bacillus sp. SM2101]